MSVKKMTDINLGWLAGIMEGEGWFVENPLSPRLSVAMTDYDTVRKLPVITGVGRLTERHFKEENKQSQLTWDVGVHKDIEDILRLVFPIMSLRRQEKMQRVLDVLEEKKLKIEWRLSYFICGHLKSEENSYHFKNSDKTSCRQCGRDKAKERYKNRNK